MAPPRHATPSEKLRYIHPRWDKQSKVSQVIFTPPSSARQPKGHFGRLRSKLLGGLSLGASVALIAGCTGGTANDAPSSLQSSVSGGEPEQKVAVVTSFSILSDMATQIGAERVNVHNLVPVGTDPHNFEPLPEDLKALAESDLVLYNGLNLEGGDDGWLAKLVASVGQEDNVHVVTSGITPLYITDEANSRQENPHAFLNPVNGVTMAENIRDALTEADPEGGDYYQQNTDRYLEELAEVHLAYETQFEQIPEEQRILVTSERAFQYMAEQYNVSEGYLWAIDTDENGSPAQITNLVEFVKERDVPVLFVESNVDPRPMQTVAAETDVPIGGVVYSDEIGKPGQEGDTYVTYLLHNLEVITYGLAGSY